MSDVFRDREKGFERKFQLDQEQQFRAQVRTPQWQQQFLSMPLARRKEIIAGLREGSREAH